MNRGMYDDDQDDHEVPGHGPTVILAHLDGDEVALPRAVEQRLRGGRPDRDAEEALWQRAHELDWRPDDVPPPPDDDESEDEPAALAPINLALALCVLAQVVVQLLLVALRVGGALDWSWGWTLAPLWVPSTVATVLVVVIGLALAALDERDAARRRRA